MKIDKTSVQILIFSIILVLIFGLGITFVFLSFMPQHGLVNFVPDPATLQISNTISDLTDELTISDQKTLHTYGIVDTQKQIYRIPIEHAMELVVQEYH